MKKKMGYSEASLEVILFEDLGEEVDVIVVSTSKDNYDPDGWL